MQPSITQASNYLFEHLGIKELAKIIHEYNSPIPYELWQINKKLWFEAATQGNLIRIKELLEKNEIDINEKKDTGETALICATYWGHIKIVELLINAKADLCAKDNLGKTALMWAFRANNWEIFELLKEAEGKQSLCIIC